MILSTRKNPCTNTRDPLKHRRHWEDELGWSVHSLACLTPSLWNNWFRSSCASLVQWWGADLYSVSEIRYCRTLMLLKISIIWCVLTDVLIHLHRCTDRRTDYMWHQSFTLCKLTHKGLITAHLFHHAGTRKFCNPSSLSLGRYPRACMTVPGVHNVVALWVVRM